MWFMKVKAFWLVETAAFWKIFLEGCAVGGVGWGCGWPCTMRFGESSVWSFPASLISWGLWWCREDINITPHKNEFIYPTKIRILISWGVPEQAFVQLWLAVGWGTILMPLFYLKDALATEWEPNLAAKLCPAVSGRLRLPLDFFFLTPASWEVLCWSSATCGCKLNCDKYTEQCIAWRLKSMLACAQTKLFFTCSSFKWSHFKGAAYFVVCMHYFFLPEEKYQNNKSSLRGSFAMFSDFMRDIFFTYIICKYFSGI